MKKVFLFCLTAVAMTGCFDNNNASTDKENSNKPEIFSSSNKPSDEFVEQVKEEIKQGQSMLPVSMGGGLTLTAMEYDDANYTIKYKYKLAVAAKEPINQQKVEEAAAQGKETAVAMIKNSPRENKILENGISYRYDYYDKNDKYVYTINITQDDIK